MVIDMNYWTKVFRKLIILVLMILGVYLGFKLAVFYIPFLIAFILSFLIEPIIRSLMKNFKLKRRTSAIIVFIVVIGIIIGIITFGIITLIQETSNMLINVNENFEKIYGQVQELVSMEGFNKIKITGELQSIIQNMTGDLFNSASNIVKQALTKILNTITSIPKVGVYVAICVISLYFMCTDKIYMLDQIDHHLPETWTKKLLKHIKEIVKALGCYLKAQALLILISFVISIIGLYIFKIARIKYSVSINGGFGNWICRCTSDIWFWYSDDTMGCNISF